METENQMKYTLAFLFSKQVDAVLLIKKKHKPQRHIGKYNGLGGHIEPGESSRESIAREVKEECGIGLVEASYDKFAVMQGSKWLCFCYRAFIDGLDEYAALDTREGLVEAISLSELNEIPKVCNVEWLIGLALDLDCERLSVKIHYA